MSADTLPDGTRVPAGALMLYSSYAINRIQEFWGDNADEFRWGGQGVRGGAVCSVLRALCCVSWAARWCALRRVHCPIRAVRSSPTSQPPTPVAHHPHDPRPERWLEFAHVPSPYSAISFHAGPRICLGQRLAELEGVYVLVRGRGLLGCLASALIAS